MSKIESEWKGPTPEIQSFLPRSSPLRNDDGDGYEMERNNLKHNNLRKFKKLRRLLQRKVTLK